MIVLVLKGRRMLHIIYLTKKYFENIFKTFKNNLLFTVWEILIAGVLQTL